MPIVRINQFEAREGEAAALRELLESFMPAIESSEGCLSVRLLESRDEPEHLVVIEEWESEEAHQAAVANMPPGAAQRAMLLLAGPPKGGYYRG